MKKQRDDEDKPTPREIIHSSRFPEDALLRMNGYKIHRRYKDQEPLWENDKRIIPHNEALRELPQSQRNLLL